MRVLKWPAVFQYIIVTLGVTIGIYLSMKSNPIHAKSHKGMVFSTPMNHGLLNISSDLRNTRN